MRTPRITLLLAALLPALGAAGARASDAASLLLDVECRLRSPDEGTGCASLSGFLYTRATFYDADPTAPLHVEERLQRFDAGTVHLHLDAGADAELFRTLFDAPETSILTVPGLRLRLERRKADGTWVRVTDVRYRPVAHALYARHSEDTPMLLDRIDLAEAGAIEAARNEALRLVAGEATARTAADAHLQGELAALRGLASPLPADCAAGQLLVADGAGGFGCGTQCSPRQSDCDGRAENACETDVLASMDHCGGCGLSCSTENLEGGVCAAGVCSGTCQPGFADCNADLRADGCERIVVDDPLNCGACDRACSDNGIAPVCEGAECVGTCVAGRADCDGDKQSNGCEGDLASDPQNCGGCGRVCPQLPGAAVSCVEGRCQSECPAGDCNDDPSDGCQTDVSTLEHCGACNAPCSTNHVANAECGATCIANICLPPLTCRGTCEAGYANCDNDLRTNGCEVDLRRDARNCGACGRVCGAAQFCDQGVCTGFLIQL
jgi:hypothetical protein